MDQGDQAGRPEEKRVSAFRPVRVLAVVVVLMLVAAGCGSDEPELTVAEQLALIEGRELTVAELDDRLAVADALCGMSDEVLDALWRTLDDNQLEFQDVVFSEICPDRSIFYAGLTGRFVTDDAVESGVVTSTTRPAVSTTEPSTSGSTTSEPATSEPATTTAEAEPSATTSASASSTSTTAPTTTAPTTTAPSTTALATVSSLAPTTTDAPVSTEEVLPPEGEGG